MKVEAPFRVTRTYVQKLQASPEEVFPLLCPVRETEWVDGWDPLIVYSRSGLAEPDCVFVTGNDEPDSVWVITNRDSDIFKMDIVKVTPWTTIARISISLIQNEQSGTDATVTYTYTAISEAGRDFINSYTESYYAEFMRFWETRINDYLLSKKGLDST